MKTFIADIIPRIQRFSQELDNLTLLTNQHWVLIENIENEKRTYVFRANNELLISNNGKIEKGRWEYIGNNSILIDFGSASYLFKHGFFDENLLALKLDGKPEYALFVNENKHDGELNSSEKVLDFLKTNYIDSPQRREIEAESGWRLPSEEEQKASAWAFTVLVIVLILILIVIALSLGKD